MKLKQFSYVSIIALTVAVGSGFLAASLMKSKSVTAQANAKARDCDNHIPVPNLVQGMTYQDARQLIINTGWQAQYNTDPNIAATDSRIAGMISQGWSEVEACSGTGLGLCKFSFRDAFGRYLSVTTADNIVGEGSQEYNSTVFGWSVAE